MQVQEREPVQNSEILFIYSTISGLHLEKVSPESTEYVLYMTSAPQRRSAVLQTRVFEARMCWKMNNKGRTEYKIAVHKIPCDNFAGLTVNEQLTVGIEGLKDLFKSIKVAAEKTKNLF